MVFRDRSLRSNDFFYEASVQCEEPEELRGFLHGCFGDAGFKIIKSGAAEGDAGLASRFLKWGGVRVFHSRTEFRKDVGTRKAFLNWSKLFLLASFVFMSLSALFQLLWFPALTIASIVLAAFFFVRKEDFVAVVRVKASGVYSPRKKAGFAKVILAGGSGESSSLEDVLDGVYEILLSKYSRTERLKVPLVKGAVSELDDAIEEFNEGLERLREKFYADKISEDTFKQEKGLLESKRACLKDLLDLAY